MMPGFGETPSRQASLDALPSAAGVVAMSEDNKALVRSMFERADRSDISLVDEILAPGYVDHDPPPFQGPATGAEGARNAFETATKIFSDWSHEIVQQFSDGDYVITRLVGRGKHTGDFMGIPATGNAVEMRGIAIHRVVDGKIVEHWGEVDGLGMMMQLGVVPPPG
jgi:predicted ester cyclase